jgi:hypothetical protein
MKDKLCLSAIVVLKAALRGLRVLYESDFMKGMKIFILVEVNSRVCRVLRNE